MIKHGDLVTTNTKRSGPQPAAHVVEREVNGIITTRCGATIRSEKYMVPTEDNRPCGKCGLHLAENPDRKRFVRDAYLHIG